MAYIAPRKNADGDITSYQVKWRLGGARSGPWQIERFDEEDPAVVFRDAVNAAGQQWPPGWVKGQGYRAIRAWCRRHGIAVTIPERSDQVANRLRRGSRGGRPPAFDAEAYKHRNVVERCFNRLKQFRAVATRFDKLADRYQAGLRLASLILWLREPGSAGA